MSLAFTQIFLPLFIAAPMLFAFTQILLSLFIAVPQTKNALCVSPVFGVSPSLIINIFLVSY